MPLECTTKHELTVIPSDPRPTSPLFPRLSASPTLKAPEHTATRLIIPLRHTRNCIRSLARTLVKTRGRIHATTLGTTLMQTPATTLATIPATTRDTTRGKTLATTRTTAVGIGSGRGRGTGTEIETDDLTLRTVTRHCPTHSISRARVALVARRCSPCAYSRFARLC